MLTTIEDIAGISEPDALCNVRADSFEERAKLLHAVVALQCKDLSRNHQAVVLKPRSLAISSIREMSTLPSNKRDDDDVKLLFMYRDPIKTIASYAAMLESLPVTKLLAPKFAEHVVEGVKNYPDDILNVVHFTNRMQAAVASMNLVELSSLAFLAHVAAYVYANKSGTKIHVVKYECLISDPCQELKGIFDFCNISVSKEDLVKCRNVMNQGDSQEGSAVQSQQTGEGQKSKDFSKRYLSSINHSFELFGFPKAEDFDSLFTKNHTTYFYSVVSYS